MNPKTLQHLMGHADISVTLNTYTHFHFEDAVEEVKRLENNTIQESRQVKKSPKIGA